MDFSAAAAKPVRRRPKRSSKTAAAASAAAPEQAGSPPDSGARTAAANATTTDWNSKRPKPPDSDILSYLLTSGGELARRAQSKTDDADLPPEALRANVFKEIKNGEASLACHERGSRVLEGLVKNCGSEELFQLFTRLKPYVGYLAYDKYASHVLQAVLKTVAASEAHRQDAALVDLVEQFGAQVNKVDEWWPMMHDASGSHTARALVSCLHALGLDLHALGASLDRAALSDLRGAAKVRHKAWRGGVCVDELTPPRRTSTPVLFWRWPCPRFPRATAKRC
jgi:hypothetical protein